MNKLDNIKSISRILLRPSDKLLIKLTVSIRNNSNEESYYSVYETQSGSYITLDVAANLKFEYKNKEVQTEWSRQNFIYINNKNIYQLKMGLMKFKEILYNENTFIYYDTGDIKLNNDESITINLGNSQFLALTPMIIYDNMDNVLPGVLLQINNKYNAVDLSITEFESILGMMSTFDLNTESGILLNSYLLMSNQTNINSQVYQKPLTKPTKEYVSGSLFNRPKTLNDL